MKPKILLLLTILTGCSTLPPEAQKPPESSKTRFKITYAERIDANLVIYCLREASTPHEFLIACGGSECTVTQIRP